MRITIGVPFFNVGDQLLDCVKSVFAQTEQDWELLLVDDGSTDNSLAIAQSIDDPRVQVISDGHNLGLSARLNQIAELARGDFIARQDADDLMHPARLADQAACLDELPHLDAVGCPWIAIDDEAQVVGGSPRRGLDLRSESVIRRVPLSHGTVLCRRAWSRRIPYASQLRRAQDREFWIRAVLTDNSRLAMCEDARYFYRISTAVPLDKTLAGYSTDRSLLREYGPARLGRWRTAARIYESYAKTALWRLAAPTPATKWLSTRRYAPLDKHQQAAAQLALEQILKYTLPRHVSESSGGGFVALGQCGGAAWRTAP